MEQALVDSLQFAAILLIGVAFIIHIMGSR